MRPTELVVIAYAPSGERVRTVPVDDQVPIGDFPEDTEQLGVEARLGGSPIAVGKTARLAFKDLPDGLAIPIFMGPPNGFCPVGEMRVARRAPLVAKAGDGVIVVGGFDAAGDPLKTAERYDPTTGTFVDVVVPSILGQLGFAGATLTSLPDGRVVLAGGPQAVATIYDPTTHAFAAESVLIESRLLHAALATEGNQLVLLGGCSSVQMNMCFARLGSKLYEATDTNTMRELMPSTTLRAGRLGASIFDIGIGTDGKRTFVMAGGAPPVSGPLDGADVFALGASDASLITGSFAQAAALDGGGVLTAFAADGDPANGSASVLAPAGVARAIARAPDLTGVRLAALENGRVVGIGGDPAGDVVRYDPMLDDWERVDSDGPITSAPVLHALDDGSYLVLGGTPITNQAFVYRPPLLGASSGSVTVVTSGPARANVLTPADPATVTRGTSWVLAAGAEPSARALAGGPRMQGGTIRVVARVLAGGVGVVAQQTGPGHALVAELVPGLPARIQLLDGPMETTLCAGTDVAAFDRDIAVTIVLEVKDGRVRLRRDGAEVVSCNFTGERGAWGVAALGMGAEVAVDSVALNR